MNINRLVRRDVTEEVFLYEKKVVVRKFVHRHRCTDTGAGARTGTGAYDQMKVSYLKQTFLNEWGIFAPVRIFLHRCKNVCTGAYIAPVLAPIPPVLFLFFSHSRPNLGTFLFSYIFIKILSNFGLKFLKF